MGGKLSIDNRGENDHHDNDDKNCDINGRNGSMIWLMSVLSVLFEIVKVLYFVYAFLFDVNTITNSA